jgi:thiamine biosynthesis lipoprotein
MSEGTGVYIVEDLESLGTVWYIEVFDCLSSETIKVLYEDLKQIITSFDDAYSRFKQTSLVSELNNNRRVWRDRDLLNMLTIGIEANNKSQGVFSLFIEQQLVEKGYGEHAQVLKVESEKLKVDTDEITKNTTFEVTDSEITLHGSGRVDLGGIGKGYLIDKIKERLERKWNIDQFVINGGGDLYATHHGGLPVEIYLQHPTYRDEVVGKVALKNKAFCSSSSYVRTWEKGGVKKNHFVTKAGRDVWAASYVVGDSTTDADIAATVLCITSDDEEKSKDVAKAFSVDYLVYDKDFHSHGDLEYTDLTHDA